eukprot:Platyproteum_vivax@DN6176_c0_g1_i1.p1
MCNVCNKTRQSFVLLVKICLLLLSVYCTTCASARLVKVNVLADPFNEAGTGITENSPVVIAKVVTKPSFLQSRRELYKDVPSKSEQQDPKLPSNSTSAASDAPVTDKSSENPSKEKVKLAAKTGEKAAAEIPSKNNSQVSQKDKPMKKDETPLRKKRADKLGKAASLPTMASNSTQVLPEPKLPKNETAIKNGDLKSVEKNLTETADLAFNLPESWDYMNGAKPYCVQVTSSSLEDNSPPFKFWTGNYPLSRLRNILNDKKVPLLNGTSDMDKGFSVKKIEVSPGCEVDLWTNGLFEGRHRSFGPGAVMADKKLLSESFKGISVRQSACSKAGSGCSLDGRTCCVGFDCVETQVGHRCTRSFREPISSQPIKS